MAEAFSNSIVRYRNKVLPVIREASVAAASTEITVSSNVGIAVSDLVDNGNFIAGTKVTQINGVTIYTIDHQQIL